MNANLKRLFRPKTVAVIGGSWAKNVVDQCSHGIFGSDLAGESQARNDGRSQMLCQLG